MNVRTCTFPILTIFILMGTFGAFALMGPMHAEMGCPFMLGQTALCTTNTLEHLKHWQVAFAGIFAETLALAALALIFVRQWGLSVLQDRSFERIRIRSRAPDRPTLTQELFSRGILNPRVF